LLGLVAAPAVVHVANLMPISVFKELRYASFDGMPPGWFQCDGGLLRCADYPELFSAMGNVHGGDGVTTFAVPNLTGRQIPGRSAEFQERLVAAINVKEENGIPLGMIRTMRKPRVPMPPDTQAYYSPFSGYAEFPPKGWDRAKNSISLML
jgi:hypothetical protein